jgi:type I restriction enzyme S subunit
MSKYPFVPLGEVCDFIRGVSFDGNEAIEMPKEGYIPILRAGNIGDELYIHDDLVWVPEKRVAEEQYFQIGDIAICMASGSPAVLGKTAQLKEDFVGSVGAFCGIIRPTKADANYIAYWLKSPTFMAWRDAQANGVNIQNLRPNEVREIEIPLPPLAEQKRIASLLGRADRLRQLRRAANALADSLLQSVFLEMFGEPQVNDNKWEKVEIGEITESLDYRRVPVESSIRQTKKGTYPYYGASGIIDYVDEYLFDEETLLVAEDGANLLARSTPIAFIASGKYWVNNHAHVLRMKNVNIQFLRHFLNITDLEPYVTGSAQPKLNASNMEKIRVINPPLALQEEFARVAARVEGLRARMAESARQAEELEESLLNQSFGGEKQ